MWKRKQRNVAVLGTISQQIGLIWLLAQGAD